MAITVSCVICETSVICSCYQYCKRESARSDCCSLHAGGQRILQQLRLGGAGKT